MVCILVAGECERSSGRADAGCGNSDGGKEEVTSAVPVAYLSILFTRWLTFQIGRYAVTWVVSPYILSSSSSVSCLKAILIFGTLVLSMLLPATPGRW